VSDAIDSERRKAFHKKLPATFASVKFPQCITFFAKVCLFAMIDWSGDGFWRLLLGCMGIWLAEP